MMILEWINAILGPLIAVLILAGVSPPPGKYVGSLLFIVIGLHSVNNIISG